MPYCSMHIEVEVHPSSEDIEFIHGEEVLHTVVNLTNLIDEKIYQAICSALKTEEGFSKLPNDITVTVTVHGDEFCLVLYPKADRQNVQLGDCLVWTDKLLHGGKMGKLKEE